MICLKHTVCMRKTRRVCNTSLLIHGKRVLVYGRIILKTWYEHMKLIQLVQDRVQSIQWLYLVTYTPNIREYKEHVNIITHGRFCNTTNKTPPLIYTNLCRITTCVSERMTYRPLGKLQLSGPIYSYQDVEEVWTEYVMREHPNRSIITLSILVRF